MSEPILSTRWYAVPNDLIGGWTVATRDVPCSQLEPGEELMDTGSEEIARYVSAMHNYHAARSDG